MDKQDLLKQYFGHTEFRPGQSELIDNILAGRDAFGIMPTGAGKSVCYQIPALMLKGVTLVISPLISLMKDQVSALVESGVKAAYINSSLTFSQYKEVLRRTMNGMYKIIYVAPERLGSEDFLRLAEQVKIEMVTVDEAHCVSQWGQDFRPSYLKIVEFIGRLPYRPVISAFTATATSVVREDIIKILRLQNPYVVTTGFDRKNLYFEVQKPHDKLAALLKILKRYEGKSGIVYCSTRKAVESVCDDLINSGFSATRYHAGIEDTLRHSNQDDFIYDRKAVMVATNAFGMGIDKSNVSFVVHYNMPKDLESYYQEAGRAGRDGEPAECILLYSGQDVQINQFLIDNNRELNEELDQAALEEIKRKDRERLKAMTYYCITAKCLREYILRYFGESAPNFCGNCSNCNSNFETVDITVEAQKIVSCVYRIEQRGRSFGKNMIADILHGSKNEKLLRFGLDTLTTYGIMPDTSVLRIRSIIDFLIDSSYLTLTADEYPVVHPSERSNEIVRDKKAITMKLPKEEAVSRPAREQTAHMADEGLLGELKSLRNRLASEAHVPAYIIFTDATLREMCEKLPQTDEEFLGVSGVGKVKQERYGKWFMLLIGKYANSQKPPDNQTIQPPPPDRQNYREKVIQSGSVDAYQPWTEDEDVQLKNELRDGLSIREISENHLRTKGAILARLKKLTGE